MSTPASRALEIARSAEVLAAELAAAERPAVHVLTIAWSEGDRLFSRVPSAAILSEDKVYRFGLSRCWNLLSPVRRFVNFTMLNPSVADSVKPDPTMTRCVNFAKSWGFDGMILTNLFSYRSTDPKALKTAADPVGPGNDEIIIEVAKRADLHVVAWGPPGKLFGRDKAVLGLLRASGIGSHCLARTKDGYPGHPLMLRSGLQPVPFYEVEAILGGGGA